MEPAGLCKIAHAYVHRSLTSNFPRSPQAPNAHAATLARVIFDPFRGRLGKGVANLATPLD